MAGGILLPQGLCNPQSSGDYTAWINPTVGHANATYGSWSTVIASTANDASAMSVISAANTNIVPCGTMNIGIGSAGNEVVICRDMVCTNRYPVFYNCIPVHIPKGTRIAAQVQERTYTNTYDGTKLHVTLYDGAFAPGAGAVGMEALGIDPVNLCGVTVTSDASANVKGAYAEVAAATARDYIGFYAVIDNLGNTSTFYGSGGIASIDIAIGAASSEIIVVPDWFIADNYGGAAPSAMFVPLNIPIGTRLSARMMCNGAGGKTIGLSLHGVFA